MFVITKMIHIFNVITNEMTMVYFIEVETSYSSNGTTKNLGWLRISEQTQYNQDWKHHTT